MKSLLLMLLTLIWSTYALSWVDQEVCAPPISDEQFEHLVEETRKAFFPHLSQLEISIKKFDSDEYYLQAKPDYSTLLKKRNRREYFIEINTRLLNCPPESQALEAILVHEFEHLNDYNSMSSMQVAKLGIQYLSKKSRTKYERSTDEKALTKGVGNGLIAYRKWIYQRLTPDQILVKKRYYFTPEEIEQWMLDHP